MPIPHPKALSRESRTRRWQIACLLVIAGFALACEPDAPAPSWPSDNWVVGDAAALSSVATGLAEFVGTPIGRHAELWLERAGGCAGFVAQAPQGATTEQLIDSIRCVDSVAIPPALQTLQADSAAAFSFPLAGGGHVYGRIPAYSDAGQTIEAHFEPPADGAEGDRTATSGAVSLLVQGRDSAGAPAFSTDDALVHARVRPAAGLDLASLVSQGSQADQMFHLRSELFVGALLEGSWEIAIYLPREAQVTPPMALALDHTLRVGAERAMQTFVGELEATWPIHHSRQRIAGHEGACFHDLRLLPDLVPCYVVTARSIVIGWNPTSIELALGRSDAAATFVAGPVLDERGGWLVHLDRFPEADERLQRQLRGHAPPKSLARLFDSLRVDARVDANERAGVVSLHAELVRNARVGVRP